MTSDILKEIDEMSLPKGWTHDFMIKEAYTTGTKIRKVFENNGQVTFGPKEVEHMTNLIGYLAKTAAAYRAATEEALSPR